MTTREKMRPLGCEEIMSSSRHALGLYRRLANTCQYQIDSSLQQPLQTLFTKALIKVVLEQVSLQVGIAGESTNAPYFVQIESIDIGKHLEWCKTRHDTDLLHLLEDEQVQLFPDISNVPPWKVIVAETPEQGMLEVLFLVHHSLCDGRSAATFHRRLLKALNEPTERIEELQGHVLNLPRHKLMVPSMEEMIKFEISWTFLLKTLWKELGPTWLQFGRPRIPWTGGRITIEPHLLHLRTIEFDNKTTDRLLRACRTEAVTLTGLIHSLLLLSLSRRIPYTDAEVFRGSTPISLAALAKAPAGLDILETISNNVTGLNHDFDLHIVEQMRLRHHGNSGLANSKDLVWDQARKVRKLLKDKVDSLPRDDIISLLSWVSDWRRFWLNRVGNSRAVTWEVSNIGSIDFDGSGEQNELPRWKILRSLFSQPVMVTGATFALSIVSVKGGSLTLTLNWQETVLDNALGNHIAGDIDEWLREISNQKQ